MYACFHKFFVKIFIGEFLFSFWNKKEEEISGENNPFLFG